MATTRCRTGGIVAALVQGSLLHRGSCELFQYAGVSRCRFLVNGSCSIAETPTMPGLL